MNETPASQQWNPMLSATPGDDFADFLDLGDLNFSYFPDEATDGQEAGNAREQNGAEAMDHTMEDAAGLLGMRSNGHIDHHSQQALQNGFLATTPTNPYAPDHAAFAHYTHHAGRSHEHPQQQWGGPNMVPPTPNSIELQAGHAHHYPSGLDIQQQQLYEHYRRIQKDQVNFTPLISPAVTPLDTQNRYHEYSNEAFSPLTSPALRAQSHATSHSAYGSVRGSDTSATTSPHDLNYEYPAPTSASAGGSVRRSRRKMSTSSAKIPGRAVKQSPAMKPQHKKKQASSTVIPPKEVATVLEEATAGTRLDHPASNSNGSMTESMSPEALSDILMPPPATPQSSSAGRSPQIDPMISQSKAPGEQSDEPATPASLMRIKKQAQQASTRKRGLSKSKQRDAPNTSPDESMEGVESTSSTKPRSRDTLPLTGGMPNTANGINRPSRPTSIPISTSATAPSSTLPSPITSAITSPTSFRAPKSMDFKSKSRDPKKRSNGPSEKASPAIRPRISPSIKPLLPEGTTVSPETSALLLASKSNYQNILEGTHFPGVSYPENLSTNLTSKRTSHKIAEQGRRNRINTALQDIAALLPPIISPTIKPLESSSGGGAASGDSNGSPSSGSKGKGGAAMSAAAVAQQQSNSKASTVEAAIDYIKALQKEVRECRVKIADLEGKAPSPSASAATSPTAERNEKLSKSEVEGVTSIAITAGGSESTVEKGDVQV